MRNIFLLFLLACVSPVESIGTVESEVKTESICDYALCNWDFQCASECSGPAMCQFGRCDGCPGRCVALTSVP